MAEACLERVRLVVWEAGREGILDKPCNEVLDGPTRVDEPLRDGVLTGLNEGMVFTDRGGVEGCKFL